MNKTILLQIAMLLFICPSAEAQNGKSGNFISLSYNPRLYLNKAYVENNDISPNPIQTKNTYGYSVGLVYERITKHNIIFEGGFEYGIQKHDVHIVQDFTNFDPNASALNGFVADRSITLKTKYINPRALIGYRLPLNKNWAVVGKIGVGVYLFYNGIQEPSKAWMLTYQQDNGTTVTTPVLSEDVHLGDNNRKWTSHSFSFPIQSYECYLGTEYYCQSSIIKKITLGIQATRAIRQDDPASFISTNSWGNVSQRDNKIVNRDYYKVRNLSVGLKMGISLWK